MPAKDSSKNWRLHEHQLAQWHFCAESHQQYVAIVASDVSVPSTFHLCVIQLTTRGNSVIFRHNTSHLIQLLLQAVPRCVLQLVAVGCVFLATKQLEVTPPSAEQLVAVAAHSFSKNDLLRVERVLLDCLDFCVAPPTAYSYLHLLTQVCRIVRCCTVSASLILPPQTKSLAHSNGTHYRKHDCGT